jgi:Tfp pilus assembly protein PilF
MKVSCVLTDTWKRKLFGALARASLACALAATPSASRAEESHPGIGLEPMYSEAVLAYNRKNMDEAIRVLDELLKLAPDHVQALELKALSLKSKGDDKRSLQTYARLAKLKPPADRGPYLFEMGVIHNRQKNAAQAKLNFEKALALGFNAETSRLFLGLIAFNSGDMKEASDQLRHVAGSSSAELRLVGLYYLGLIGFKTGQPSIATSQVADALELALTLPDSAIAKDIRSGAEKMLQPFSRSQWFATLTSLGQYDSNVSQVPTISAFPLGGSGQPTAKLSVIGGLGWMTAPMSTIQWVPSYRFSYNRNFASAARGYEFFINTASMFLNYRPLARTTGGLKLEGNFAFQNQLLSATDASSGYVFRKFSLGGDLGPYVRHQLGSQSRVELELLFRPQRYYGSPSLSGSSVLSRLSYRGEPIHALLNPGVSASFESRGAESADFRFRAYSLGLANLMRLKGLNTVTASVDLTLTSYPEASASRSDRTIGPRLSWLKVLTPKWSLLADLSLTWNKSTIPESYSYNRLQAGAGVSRSF